MAGFCVLVSSGTHARDGKRARRGHTRKADAEKNMEADSFWSACNQ